MGFYIEQDGFLGTVEAELDGCYENKLEGRLFMPLRLMFVLEDPVPCGPMGPERILALASALLNRCARAACVSEKVLQSVPKRYTLNWFTAETPRRHPMGPEGEPFTSASPGRPAPAAGLRVAVTWLCDPEAIKLLEWTRSLSGHPLSLESGSARFTVAPVSDDRGIHFEGAWAPYSKILLDASPTRREVTLKFCTPTLLSRDALAYPLPDPGLVFRAYLDLWNVFSGLPLSSDLSLAIESELELKDFRLRRRSFGVPPGRQAAFGGSATFGLRGRHPESVLKGFNALADFAEFCGTGTGTELGMGLTRQIQKRTAERAG